jgi:hypothetical protein
MQSTYAIDGDPFADVPPPASYDDYYGSEPPASVPAPRSDTAPKAERSASGAVEIKISGTGPTAQVLRFKRPGEPSRKRGAFQQMGLFMSKFEPLAFVLDGVLRSGSLYTMTAKTGAGKTAFNVVLALAVATGEGKRLLGRDVEQGRVLYIALENPDDVRMRFLAACFLLNIDPAAIGDMILIEDRRRKTEDIIEDMRREGQFRLVVVDTFAAHFDGKDVNNPVESGEFMRRYRPIPQLPGRPTVLVSAHPVKNAARGNLVPYGAGAILNEVDGNLTLENESGRISLHWQGKIRGADFDPIAFRLEAPPCPDVKDVKGRQLPVPVLMPSSARVAEQAETADQDIGVKLLVAMIDNPSGTQEQWAAVIGRSKGRVNGYLVKLKNDSLVEQAGGKWLVRPKGKRLADTFKPQIEGENDVPPTPEQEPICSAPISDVPAGTELQ